MDDIRKSELEDLAGERLQDYIEDEFWNYHNWDDLIECEEDLTGEELQWMREHITFTLEAHIEEDEE